MQDLQIGWMYPDLLNLHGERGSVLALQSVAAKMGINAQIKRIEDFDDPIDFENLDMMLFLPGEIAVIEKLIPALNKQKDGLDAYLERGGNILAIGTSGLMFGKEITREDGSVINGLGYLDMTATERRYVYGNDLHVLLNDTKQTLIGSQIQMADVKANAPIGQVLYGMGNCSDGSEGCRYKNLIYTNCLGPLFVKNPWFAESLLKDICLAKYLGIRAPGSYPLASASYDSTLRFIKQK